MESGSSIDRGGSEGVSAQDRKRESKEIDSSNLQQSHLLGDIDMVSLKSRPANIL